MSKLAAPCLLAVLPVLGAGCAASSLAARDGDTARAAREDLQLTGRPYALTHLGAVRRPGALHGPGGRIQGQVCGAAVGLNVDHRGGPLVLEGRVADEDTEIWVGREGGALRMSGNLGGLGLDVRLTDEGLSGRMGRMPVILQATGDSLAGSSGRARFVAEGLAGLRRMPAAVQGALLPLLLACAGAHEQRGQVLAKARFAPPATARSE
jgi:hypothetical protein